MKVLISAYECDPDRGSEYGRSWSWIMDYLNKGFDVYCLTSKRGEESITRFLNVTDLPGVKFYFIEATDFFEKKYGKGTLWTYGHYLIWLKKASRLAKELANTTEFDFAHHVSWGSLQLGTFLWRLNIPYIYGPLGGGQFAPEELKPFFLEGWSLEVKRKLISDFLVKYNKNTRFGIRNAACVLVVNEETKKLAIELGACRVEVVIDTNLKEIDLPLKDELAEREKSLKLIWAGRLLYRKGLPLVLRAMSKLSPNLPITLSIYGDGPFGEALPKFISDLQIDDKVTWYGQVPLKELKQAYLAHDVFVFCTLRESLGVQFFEAMGHGLPVIALDIHGARTAIPNNAGIKLPIEPTEKMVDSLADAIEKLYYDEDARLESAIAAKKYIQKLLMVDRVENILSLLDIEKIR